MVQINRKFNEEQLLLEIFFPKMHIERDNRKKLISGGRGVQTAFKKKAPGGGPGVLIRCLGHQSRTLSALKLLPAYFAIFFSFAQTITKVT